jgi:hypothetical protein
VRWAAAYVERWRYEVKLTPFQRNTLAHARAVLQRWENRQAIERELAEAEKNLPTGSQP